jgi:hypothetical protein
VTKQWTAGDERDADDRVTGALWDENSHDGWSREDAIAERCEEAEKLRKKAVK